MKILHLFKSDGNKGKRPVLKDLLTDETIQMADQIKGWEEAIQTAAKPLLDKEVILKEYTDAMIDNVKRWDLI
ncbi:PTS sugar transporter subunit IIA [Bacillus licheniformis]|nr:PTS sugar transporter subunit IIA [Bacillus licheniformis]